VLAVSNRWKDVQGSYLQQSYSKNFFVGARDSIPPQPDQWIIHLPQAETTQPVRVSFGEPLDYFLLQETLQILDEKGAPVEGKIRIINNERGFEFFPSKQWPPDHYRIQITSHLEDLAGNNLNRPFDRDIQRQQAKKDKDFVEKKFIISKAD
jgi:hypothetical protein